MARPTACIALLIVAGAGLASAVQLPKPETPKTQNDDAYYLAARGGPLVGPPINTYGTTDLPDDSPLFATPNNTNTPAQVVSRLISPTEIWVTFATGVATNGTYSNTTGPPGAPNVPAIVPFVQYGTSSGSYTNRASGSGSIYTQTANNGTSAPVYYISPFLWTAKLRNLAPATRYYYVVSNTDFAPTAPKTTEFSFATQHAVGDDAPITIGVIGDLGETYNSSDTLAHAMGNKPDIMYNMGDLTYADHYLNNNPVQWDHWANLVSPAYSASPMALTNGNHEVENGNGNNQGTRFQSYSYRYPTPYAQSKSTSNLYYSISHGPVHTLFLSQYTDYSKASAQYAWAAADFASINRTATPWVMVVFHGPVYHTYTTHYKQYDCFRQVWEPLFNSAGVDIAMSGHVHAYERSNPVNNYTADATGCAPTYITIGDGGNSERLYHAFVDGNYSDGTSAGTDGCPSPSSNDLSADPTTCTDPKLQVPYCTTTQPMWSAYREDAFGHGILKIYNGSVAEWFWYRNLDTLPVVTDSVVFQRDTLACPNRRQGAVLAPIDNLPPPPAASPPPPKPTAAPTASRCEDGNYLKYGKCNKCITSGSPFRRTLGGVTCYRPHTTSSTASTCASAPLSVAIRADTDASKTKTCIGRSSTVVSLLLPVSDSTYTFLEYDSYKTTTMRLDIAHKAHSSGSRVTVQGKERRLVQFVVGTAFRNRKSGSAVTLSGVLQRGKDLLPYCFAATFTFC